MEHHFLLELCVLLTIDCYVLHTQNHLVSDAIQYCQPAPGIMKMLTLANWGIYAFPHTSSNQLEGPLRFINCARNEEEQNLLSFQYQGTIYCYTIKDILPGTELLVWYGEQYVKANLWLALNTKSV